MRLGLSPLHGMRHNLCKDEGGAIRLETRSMQTYKSCRAIWAFLRNLSKYRPMIRALAASEQVHAHHAMMLSVCSAASRKRGLIGSLRRDKRKNLGKQEKREQHYSAGAPHPLLPIFPFELHLLTRLLGLAH